MAITTIVRDNTAQVLTQLNAEAQKIVLKMAELGADALRENLSAGSRSGVQYKSLPRRSSTPTEMPQEQSGRLKSMVDFGPNADGAYFGFVPNGADEREQASALELGAPRQNLIARAPVRRTALDSRVHARMRAVKL